MENVDCEKIVKEMRECVTKNQGTHNCKEIIETFNNTCNKDNKEDMTKLFLE